MRKLQTASGETLLVPPEAESHLRAHPEMEAILPEAAKRVVLPPVRVFFETEVKMDRVVGRLGRVTTPLIGTSDTTLFAQRIGRNKPSRVAQKGIVGEETATVSVIVSPSDEETSAYMLVTAWVGTLARREPWDPMIKSEEEYQDCLLFWRANALVWEPDVMSEPFESTWEQVLSA